MWNKKTKELVILGGGLILLSVLLHYVHYLIFKDLHHTLIFFMADIAFIPMEVFFSYFVFDRLLEKREKLHVLERLNILIGVFFTEIGTQFLREIVRGDKNKKLFKKDYCEDYFFNKENFNELEKDILVYDYNIDINKINVDKLKIELDNTKDLLITLVTNESLHDHGTFTEMLLSLMHLKEELDTRWNEKIEEYEKNHLEKDIIVAYKYLAIEWWQYMNYLSENYPNLYVKALIENPFDNRSKREKDFLYLQKIIEG